MLKEDVLRSGHELIITEVDCLGRNKEETLKELQYLYINYCENKYKWETITSKKQSS